MSYPSENDSDAARNDRERIDKSSRMNWVPLRKLVRKKVCIVPTWQGWIVLLCIGIVAATMILREAYIFLAVQNSLPDGILVVEGWLPSYAAKVVIEEYSQHHYLGLYATGVPIEEGSPLSKYGTDADLMTDILKRLGANPQTLHAVPAPDVKKDRTYSMALALRTYLQKQGMPASRVNLVSMGAHARRSRLLYEKAFGEGSQIGIIALQDRSFDPTRWWKSSAGFRIVTDEMIAYVYARIFFHPAEE